MPNPAFRQRADFTNPSATATTYSVTMASAVLAGDFLIMCIRCGQVFTVVSDNINGAWTPIGSALTSGSNSGGFYYKANSLAAAAGTMVVTVASNNGTTAGVTGPVIEYTGVKAVSNPIRNFGQFAVQTGGNAGTGTTPNAVASCNTGDFIIVGMWNENNNSPTYALGSLTGVTGTLTLRQAVANGNAAIEDATATSAGTTVKGSASDGSVTWALGIVALIPASSNISGLELMGCGGS